MLKKDNELFISDEGQATDGSMSVFEKNDEKEFVRMYLDSLPQLQRRVVLMRMNGHSYDEIERITGLSGGNIRVIISRLRKKFRDYFNDK